MTVSANGKGSILILDDDPTFRGLVANLLRPHGYRVVEANSPAEANTILSKKETVLAIVDYRLPQMDGMTWITKLREAGGNTPIVFCSAVPCDAKTFSWLRNILSVALIVQKPIIPSAFLQQIESLLPGYQKSNLKEGIADIEAGSTNVDREADAEMIAEMRNVAKKLKVEQAIKQARAEYYEQLDRDWKQLVSSIDEKNNNKEDDAPLIVAIRIAHSIRGTAGSLGLEDIGAVAGKLEDFLMSIDSRDTTDQEIYWSEIIRLVAKGTELVSEALIDGKDSAPSSVKNRVLILSQRDSVIDAAREEATMRLAHVQGTDSPAAFMKYAAENRLDAVIIDTASDIKSAVRDCARVRNIPGNESIPIGLLCNKDTLLTNADLIYMGASHLINGAVNGDNLRQSVKALLKISVPGQPRVLLVDDDEVLCKFAAGVLTDQRMETVYETNPIKVLDQMEAFQPDLVVLDVMMPMLTGYEVCRQIRAESRWADVPVIFLTSKTSQDARSAAFAVGASDFLTKPVLSEELVARVSSQLALASRKRKDRARDPESRMLTTQAFMAEAQKFLESYREDNKSFTLSLLEIDEFDHTTITQGFHGAHSAAAELGLILQERFSAESLRCKWSTSGYAIVVPGSEAQDVAGAMKKALDEFAARKFPGSSHKFCTTFSAGIASAADGSNLEEIVKAAHHNLRAGKREMSGAVSTG